MGKELLKLHCQHLGSRAHDSFTPSNTCLSLSIMVLCLGCVHVYCLGEEGMIWQLGHRVVDVE